VERDNGIYCSFGLYRSSNPMALMHAPVFSRPWWRQAKPKRTSKKSAGFVASEAQKKARSK